ncbi:MAG: initiation factor 2B [Proteobacteria bacterium]|nr:initiation factor 2B [Pseudomonadota bacterium]
MDEDAFRRHRDELGADRSRGAAELARGALALAAASARKAPASDAADLVRELRARADALARARPSMAPIARLLGAWRDAIAGLAGATLGDARAHAAAAAEALIERSRAAGREAARHAAAAIGANRTVITHSLSSTVLELFALLKDSGVRAIVTESRPLLEGHALAARLSEWGIPATLITEAEIGLFVARADAAVVGADAVLADGSVINKAGTYLLALAAREAGVPFYVCAESFKWLPPDALPPALEEMDAAELGAPRWPRVEIANIYFDLTPARLVSAWFSEDGGKPREGRS